MAKLRPGTRASGREEATPMKTRREIYVRRHAKAVFVLAVLCSFFATAVTASAAYKEIGSFAGNGSGPGGSGSENGQLSDPGEVAVDDSTGRIYVADTGNNRVETFASNSSGAEYESQVAITAPTGIAVDQATGDVYVAGASGIAKFDSSLTPIALGWTDPGTTGALAVDPSTGDLLVADQGADLVRRYKSDGIAAGSFAAERPISIAADPAGEIFVVTSTGDISLNCGATSSVVRFSSGGVAQGTIGSLEATGQVAVDPDDGSIAVVAPVNQYNCGSQRLQVSYFSSTGTFREAVELGGATLWATVPGLAVQGDGSKRTYVVTKSPLSDSYGATQVTAIGAPPQAGIDSVDTESVTSTAAKFSGTVEPNGQATKWHFEYRRAGSGTWAQTPLVDAGSGEAPVATGSVSVTGLEAKAGYEVRLVAVNADGTATSNPESFQTPASAPTVTTLAASGVEGVKAVLRAAINPNNQATHYHFEYGTSTAYGSIAPAAGNSFAGEAGQPTTVVAAVTGLTPSTGYHFRIVAENATGTARGNDVNFTTAPAAAACSNEAIRIEQNATALPECRAYEMVSPLQKGGADVLGMTQRAFTKGTADGNAIAYGSSAAFADPVGAAFPSIYRAVRGADGWTTSPISPAQNASVYGGGDPDSPRPSKRSATISTRRSFSPTVRSLRGSRKGPATSIAATSKRVPTAS